MGLAIKFVRPPVNVNMLVFVPLISNVDLLPAPPALEPIESFALGREGARKPSHHVRGKLVHVAASYGLRGQSHGGEMHRDHLGGERGLQLVLRSYAIYKP